MKLLLKFYIDGSSRWISNIPKSSFGQYNGRAACRWRGGRWKSIINDFYLNRLTWLTRTGNRGTNAPDQILSPTGCPIVPYSIAGRREQIIRRKLRRVVAEAGGGYIYSEQNLSDKKMWRTDAGKEGKDKDKVKGYLRKYGGLYWAAVPTSPWEEERNCEIINKKRKRDDHGRRRAGVVKDMFGFFLKKKNNKKWRPNWMI